MILEEYYSNQKSALGEFIQQNNIDQIRESLSKIPDRDNIIIDNLPLLCFAAQYGHAEVIRVLLDANAEKEAKTNNGFTALHIAALKGHAEVIRVLLEQGANIEATTERGSTALHLAAKYGRNQIIDILLLDSFNKNKQNFSWFDNIANITISSQENLTIEKYISESQNPSLKQLNEHLDQKNAAATLLNLRTGMGR